MNADNAKSNHVLSAFICVHQSYNRLALPSFVVQICLLRVKKTRNGPEKNRQEHQKRTAQHDQRPISVFWLRGGIGLPETQVKQNIARDNARNPSRCQDELL
jgi:hypothetical protein